MILPWKLFTIYLLQSFKISVSMLVDFSYLGLAILSLSTYCNHTSHLLSQMTSPHSCWMITWYGGSISFIIVSGVLNFSEVVFKIKMVPYQDKNSNYGDKMILWPHYHHYGLHCVGKMPPFILVITKPILYVPLLPLFFSQYQNIAYL